MKRFKIFIASIASVSAVMASDITLKPGELEGIINGSGLTGQNELQIEGSIDARDFAAMEKLPKEIKELDLTNVSIEKLTMTSRKYFGKTLFNAGELPGYSFFKSGVERILLPSSTTSIGEGSFSGSSLKSIVIPEGVESIGAYAFYGCEDLETVTLPASLKSIGKGAFGNCRSLRAINLTGTAITEIPEKAFSGCLQLSSLSLPASVRKIGKEAFSHTKLEQLSLSSVTEFEPFALSGMAFLEKLTLNPQADIEEGLLMDDISLISLTGIPQYLPDYFAANCLELPTEEVIGNIVSLGNYSLANNSAPERLILDDSLTSIGRGAFSGLTTISKIDATSLGDNVPEVQDNSFEGITPGDIKLYVTDKSYDKWASDPVWSQFILTKSSTTGLDSEEALADNGISISLRGGLLTVESPTELTAVSIYAPDGMLLNSATPHQTRFEIPASELGSGIVIVKAMNSEKETRTLSIMLK